jgi:sugar-phosphatase
MLAEETADLEGVVPVPGAPAFLAAPAVQPAIAS